jgi:hypothetical protein
VVLYAHRVLMYLEFVHYLLAAAAKGTVQSSSRHYPPAPRAMHQEQSSALVRSRVLMPGSHSASKQAGLCCVRVRMHMDMRTHAKGTRTSAHDMCVPCPRSSVRCRCWTSAARRR